MLIKKKGVPYTHIKILIKPHQKQLRNSLRYERYIVDETAKEWESLLGKDVIAISHPQATVEIAERFIAFHSENQLLITEEEQYLLYTASHIHDFGELILDGQGVGDITFEEHQSTHIQVEETIFDRLLKNLTNCPEKTLITSAYYDVAMNKTSKLGEIFNAIERIGYLETGLRAFAGTYGKRIKNWEGLVGNVLSNQIIALLKYTEKYVYIDYLLQENKQLISQAFEKTIKDKVPLDKDHKPSFDKKKLQLNFSAWKSSKFY